VTFSYIKTRFIRFWRVFKSYSDALALQAKQKVLSPSCYTLLTRLTGSNHSLLNTSRRRKKNRLLEELLRVNNTCARLGLPRNTVNPIWLRFVVPLWFEISAYATSERVVCPKSSLYKPFQDFSSWIRHLRPNRDITLSFLNVYTESLFPILSIIILGLDISQLEKVANSSHCHSWYIKSSL